MRRKVSAGRSVAALQRVLHALEHEVLAASDEEIREAAQELGMDPAMKGSAAFAGIKFPARPQFSDFFADVDSPPELDGPRPPLAGPPRRRGGKPR